MQHGEEDAMYRRDGRQNQRPGEARVLDPCDLAREHAGGDEDVEPRPGPVLARHGPGAHHLQRLARGGDVVADIARDERAQGARLLGRRQRRHGLCVLGRLGSADSTQMLALLWGEGAVGGMLQVYEVMTAVYK
ncbi:hypothetical protein TPAR_03391 [Tolypocladium paradoxum]|uniref:Uncharacterized protein n=1 Tax=Tolypocladium paradoxum TaxID=94208 RepID=A0A2S4L1V4_9HYPO|nr:hypothetical protein TPAR_03391 [Tolypocladium paradoxum]